ncbi:hypothetical protein MASR2M47_15770 [Draconibacterium sp.]
MEHEPLLQGNYYHIFNRGNNRCNLFSKPEEYEHFLHLYDKYILPIADTFAWALMGNHFHFLVRIKANVVYKYSLRELETMKLSAYAVELRKWETMDLGSDRAVQLAATNALANHKIPVPHKHFAHLFNAYSRHLQKRTGRTGNLFERPFKRKMVDSDEYLKTVVLYIHNNPVHHGFCSHPKEYPWTSYLSSISEKPTKLKRDELIQLFNGTEDFKQQHKQKIDIAEIENWLEIAPSEWHDFDLSSNFDADENFNAVKSIDVDRLEERSEVAAVHFDLSACAAPDNVKMMDDNVKMMDDNVKMVDEERSAVDVDADRSKDAVRSGKNNN